MAGSIVYLDVDDEITSAAGRIRLAQTEHVALVVPHGSRVATSRINFRLLARDALAHEKRLSVVAADAASRALAASAGLSAFASVGEYEEASALAGRPVDPESAAGGTAPSAATRTEPPVAPVSPVTTAGPAPSIDPTVPPPTAVLPPAVPVRAHDPLLDGDTARIPVGREAGRRAEPASAAGTGGARSLPVVKGGGRGLRVGRATVLVGLGVLALAVLVGSVGAYVFLPSATIVVTPRTESIALPSFRVVADPDASAPDPAAGVVPAVRIDLEVAWNDTFEATGERVVEERATGKVVFSSLNTGARNTIPAGSIVSTEGGIQFRTTRAVTLDRAEIIPPLNVRPATATVDVEAVGAGTRGNVPANAITVVPRGEDPNITKVRNPDPTDGGSREVFVFISQADVDAALEALAAGLSAEFGTRLEDPSIAPAGTTVFPETADLDDPVPTIDPASLVGEELASFELGLTASGSVLAVDASPVTAIAEARIASAVRPGSELIEGSTAIEVGPAIVDGGLVSFPVSARADQVAILDGGALKAMILGLPVEEARAVLSAYGAVEMTVWPDWVASIPTFDARVDLAISRPVAIDTPAPTSAP